jgi:hypothetical protein
MCDQDMACPKNIENEKEEGRDASKQRERNIAGLEAVLLVC